MIKKENHARTQKEEEEEEAEEWFHAVKRKSLISEIILSRQQAIKKP